MNAVSSEKRISEEDSSVEVKSLGEWHYVSIDATRKDQEFPHLAPSINQ